MPTEFSLTFSSVYKSLVLVASEQIHDDIVEVHIKQSPQGGDFECKVVRANKGMPTRLVATMSREKGHASGRETIPGFIEVSPAHQVDNLRDAIARHFGYAPDTSA